MTQELTVIGILLGLAGLCVMALILVSTRMDNEQPIVTHPKVTRPDARRRLLEKARREQDWLAENARG